MSKIDDFDISEQLANNRFPIKPFAKVTGSTVSWQTGFVSVFCGLWHRLFQGDAISVYCQDTRVSTLGFTRETRLKNIIESLTLPSDISEQGEFNVRLITKGGCSISGSISIRLTRTAEYLTCDIQHSTNVSTACILRSLRAFGDDAIKFPEKTIRSLDPLHALDRSLALHEWNKTDWNPDHSLPLHRCFERQVAITPQAVALLDGDNTWSYSDLNTAANHVAHHLMRQHQTSGMAIGLYFKRSYPLVAAMLGVLKSGAAFLSLDTNQPLARLKKIGQVAKLTKVLYSETQVPKTALPEFFTDYTSYNIDPLVTDPEPLGNFSNAVSVEDPAYIIFTSGSTGEPKGVVGLHKGMYNRIFWVQNQFPYPEDAVFCQKAALSFIDFIGEVLSPLFFGKPLWIVPDHISQEPHSLVEFLAEKHVTHITTVPSLLRMILTKVGNLQSRIPELKQWICSGEELSADIPPLFSSLCNAKLYNFYGPSEASIEVSTWECNRGDIPTANIPIGKPIGNTQLYVLDENRVPVVPGVIGELYIAGKNLSSGYLNAPKENAKSFLDSPFSNDMRSKIYRTGDLAYHQLDGTLVYTGRIGRDVKVRGNRVALGEVESTISSLDCVLECAVLHRRNQYGTDQLFAYIVSNDTSKITLKQLNQDLELRIPTYMIPAYFLLIDSLPRTASGKIDRKALCLTRHSILKPEASIAPRNALETSIASSFKQVLDIPEIGIDDSFLLHGGDSLLATTLLADINARYGIDLPLSRFFMSPTVRSLSCQVEEQEKIPHSTTSINTTCKKTSELPLTSAQERLWFLSKYDGGLGYCVSSAIEITGDIDTEFVKKAVNTLWKRHDSLRSTFFEKEGRPICKRLPPCSLTTNQSTLGHEISRRAVNAFARSDIDQHPFDLSKGPLVRASLLSFTQTPSVHVLILSIHHIICDGVSIDILLKELTAIYQSLTEKTSFPAINAGLDMADYALWERSSEHLPHSQASVEFWMNRLIDAPPVLELPIDYPRPKVWEDGGDHVRVRLSNTLTGGLKNCCKESGVSLYIATYSVFLGLIYRLTHQSDIVLGSPTANRSKKQWQNTVGLFVNTIALRSQILPNQTFGELLEHAKRDCLSSFDHMNYPFEQLVNMLQPQRSLSHSPIVQLSFAVENTPASKSAGGCTFESRTIDSGFSLFDLSLSIENGQDEIFIHFTYGKSLFHRDTIKRWSRYYIRLLEALVFNPSTEIDDISLLDKTQLQELKTFGKGDSLPKVSPWRSVLSHMSQQAMDTPDAPAVIASGGHFSYQQLETNANFLAQDLIRLGVNDGQTVAICGKRSGSLIVAILAVMKCRAAWLPLDPDYPDERLEFMIGDSNATVVIAENTLIQTLFRNTPLTTVALDGYRQNPASDPGFQYPNGHIQKNDHAYLIYTSGSTGTPKGVKISHGALEHKWRSWDKSYGLSRQCYRHLQTASFSFDVFVGDMVRSLCSGAALVMTDKETLLTPPALMELIRRESVDFADFSPLVMRMLAEHMSSKGEDLSTLKVLVLGTDAWNVEDYRFWKTFVGEHTRFINAYGVTEATVASTYYHSSQSPLPLSGPVPIGMPLPGETIIIVDHKNQPVPIGVSGQICIGGPSVADGYHNRPELNQERFYDINQIRFYKTGDLGCWKIDGTIAFLGRMDAQVKIRGFRVEPGEIEGILTQHPAVKQVAVVTLDDGLIGKKLRAVAITHDNHTVSAFDIRRFAAQKMPDHMIPSSIIILPDIPMTPNGKVNRRALIDLLDPSPVDRTEQVNISLTTQEKKIEQIFQSLLNINGIGPIDNFFEYGGHSLLAIRAISKIHNVFEIELSVRDFFQHATIQGLSKLIKAHSHNQPNSNNTTSNPVEKPIPDAHRADYSSTFAACSPAQSRLLLLQHMHDEGKTNTKVKISGLDPEKNLAYFAYDVPTKFYIKGALNTEALSIALQNVIARHEVLRTTFSSPTDKVSELRQIIHQDLSACLDVIKYSNGTGSKTEYVDHRIQQALQRPFDLVEGPLLRAELYETKHNEYVFLLHMHHLVSDAWSVSIFFEELNAFYQSECQKTPIALPPLSAQYRDYACWQQALRQSPVIENNWKYWQNQLAGAPPLIELPTDFSRPLQTTYRGKSITHEFEGSLTQSLFSFTKQRGYSLYMTMLTVFAIMLYQRSGQTDICIGSPIANRGNEAFEKLIGFFVNTLVMRIRVDEQISLSQLLDQVKELTLDAFDHSDLDFEQLVEKLNPDRSLSYHPLFQVVFAMQNVHQSDDVGSSLEDTFKLDGLSIDSQHIHNGTSKFDLLFLVDSTGNSLNLTVEYSTDLFQESTIQRMLSSYESILNVVVTTPQTPIKQIPSLSQQDRAFLSDMHHSISTDYGEPHCLHRIFENRARDKPHKIALTSAEGDHITYEQLDQCANALAFSLIKKGVQPTDKVGILSNRCPEQIAAILGVLKAGAAYVPLDPAFPDKRLANMTNDAELTLILTHGHKLNPTFETEQLTIEKIFEDSATEAPNITCSTDDHIYVTFTSGSTGRPKGIAMHHLAVWNLICWHTHESTNPGATTLQFAPLGFDVSFQEIFCCFAGGGSLVLIEEEQRQDPYLLWQHIERHSIERLFLPTAALIPFSASASTLATLPTCLRECWVAGEAMVIDEDTRHLFQRLSRCRLLNYYGPSECHAVTWYQLPRDEIRNHTELWSAAPHVGRAIANTKVHILDHNDNPVPIGSTGELCITGQCVANGYMNQITQTVASFVEKTDETGHHKKMYKTGDLAYFDENGCIHLIGRRDSQIKIRGFRIEIAEIETVLLNHQTVKMALVDVDHSKKDHPLICAWIILQPNLEIDANALRAFASEQLPNYMVPSTVTFVDHYPTNANGKIDRAMLKNQLPKTVASSPTPRKQSKRENTIIKLFSNLLGKPNVHPDDCFFALGGSSLLAMKLIVQLRATFKQPLSVNTLIQHSTPSRLAHKYDTLTAPGDIQTGKQSPIVNFNSFSKSSTSLYCIHPIGGNVLCYQALSKKVQSPFFAMEAPGLHKNTQPLTSIEALATHYINAIRDHQNHQEIHLAGWSMGGLIAYEMAQQLKAGGNNVGSLTLIDTDAPQPFLQGEAFQSEQKTTNKTILLRDFKHVFGIDITVDIDTLQSMDSTASVEYILQNYTGTEANPNGIRTGDMRRLIQVYLTNFEAMHRYRGKPYNSLVTLISANNRIDSNAPLDRGWHSLTSKNLKVRKVPGDHYQIIQEKEVAHIADILNEILTSSALIHD